MGKFGIICAITSRHTGNENVVIKELVDPECKILRAEPGEIKTVF